MDKSQSRGSRKTTTSSSGYSKIVAVFMLVALAAGSVVSGTLYSLYQDSRALADLFPSNIDCAVDSSPSECPSLNLSARQDPVSA